MANSALNRTSTLMLTNKTGQTATKGQTVIINPSIASSFIYATGSQLNTIVGILMENIDSDAIGAVAVSGYISKINVLNTGSIGNYIYITTGGYGIAHTGERLGDFGELLNAGTTPDAYLWGNTIRGIGTGTASATSTGTAVAYPNKAIMFMDECVLVTGSALSFTYVNVDSHPYAYTYQQVSLANNESSQVTFFIGSGTYTISILGISGGSKGKIDWYLDEVLISSAQDWYSASRTGNVTKTISSITITSPGNHTLRWISNGKNASSSAYGWEFTKIWLK